MYLFIDTETTGLPLCWDAPATDFENWPRLVQLAWLLCDDEGDIIESANDLIIPEGFRIPDDATKIHGVTTVRAMSQGIFLDDALQKLRAVAKRANYAVAHNMNFDRKVIECEYRRRKIPYGLHSIRKACTMELTTDYCRIESIHGFKWPKLSELHEVVFGIAHADSHDAFDDVMAAKDCFFELLNDGFLVNDGTRITLDMARVRQKTKEDKEMEPYLDMGSTLSSNNDENYSYSPPSVMRKPLSERNDSTGVSPVVVIILVILLAFIFLKACS